MLSEIGGIHIVYTAGWATLFVAIAEFTFLINTFNSMFILDKDDKKQLFN
jgi:hypothetical protein